MGIFILNKLLLSLISIELFLSDFRHLVPDVTFDCVDLLVLATFLVLRLRQLSLGKQEMVELCDHFLQLGWTLWILLGQAHGDDILVFVFPLFLGQLGDAIESLEVPVHFSLGLLVLLYNAFYLVHVISRYHVVLLAILLHIAGAVH